MKAMYCFPIHTQVPHTNSRRKKWNQGRYQGAHELRRCHRTARMLLQWHTAGLHPKHGHKNTHIHNRPVWAVLSQPSIYEEQNQHCTRLRGMFVIGASFQPVIQHTHQHRSNLVARNLTKGTSDVVQATDLDGFTMEF